MADIPERRPMRIRKPTIPFDEQNLQSSNSLKASEAPKALKAPTKLSKSLSQNATIATPSKDDMIELLCDQTKELNIQTLPIIEEIEGDIGIESEKEDNITHKAKKKAKAAELAGLKKLPLKDIIKLIPDTKEVIFEPFLPGRFREPEVNIPSNIDATDPLALLDLFIPSEMYVTIAENTNLYAIGNDAPTAPTLTNTRYWWPTNEYEIRVLFGIFYYMGVHKEANYPIYWEKGEVDAPQHSISTHMTLNRYENLRRYLHISESTQLPPEPRDEEEEEQLPTEILEKLWWWKIEPLLGTFRIASRRHYTPGTKVAIDEIMVRFYGRSNDTVTELTVDGELRLPSHD